jgi:hypothetical protein
MGEVSVKVQRDGTQHVRRRHRSKEIWGTGGVGRDFPNRAGLARVRPAEPILFCWLEADRPKATR